MKIAGCSKESRNSRLIRVKGAQESCFLKANRVNRSGAKESLLCGWSPHFAGLILGPGATTGTLDCVQWRFCNNCLHRHCYLWVLGYGNGRPELKCNSWLLFPASNDEILGKSFRMDNSRFGIHRSTFDVNRQVFFFWSYLNRDKIVESPD